MMDFMRKMAPAIIVVVVLVFGGTSFVVFGTNSAQLKEANKAIGTVGTTKITRQEFQQAYNRTLDNTRSKDLTDAQHRQLPMHVWQELERNEISKQISENFKLSSTSEEVLMSLLENPPAVFKQWPYFADEKTQMFSEEKYRQIMSLPETYEIPQIRYYEDMLKQALPQQKVMELVEMTNFISASEIENQYHRENDNVKFEYLMVRPYSMDVSAKLTDEAIKSYYNDNKDKFETGEQAELYYIEVRKKATSYDEKVIKAELAEIKENILKGEGTFAEEAEIESDDEAKGKLGGVEGWKVKGEDADYSAVFGLKVGEITDPIKTVNGLEIFTVDSIKTEEGKEKYLVRGIVKHIVPTVVTLDSIDALAENLFSMADSTDLQKAADTYMLKIDSTGLVGRGDAVPGVGYHSGLGAFTFDDDNDSKTELFENEKAYFLVSVKERIEEGVLPLEHVKSRVKRILRDSLQKEAASEYLTSVLPKAKESLSSYAETDSLVEYGVTETVTRNVSVPSVGRDNKVIASAFATDLNAVSPTITEVNAVYAVKPLERTIADKITDADKKRISDTMRKRRSQSLFSEWYASYREELGVTENVRNFFY